MRKDNSSSQKTLTIAAMPESFFFIEAGKILESHLIAIVSVQYRQTNQDKMTWNNFHSTLKDTKKMKTSCICLNVL